MGCNEWKEYRLEDISQIIFSGGTPSTRNEEFWDGDIPWLSSGETRNSFINKTEKTITEEGVKNSSTKLALNGDIVIASAGQGFTRGQVSFCNIDTYINQSLIAIRANNILLNNKYLYYNLKSRYNELRQISDSHSIRGSLTTKMIKDLIIKLPSLEEQEKIANILSSLDDKIELNNEMNKILEEMAQSIFKRWFVDFEFPNEDGEPYKSSGGEMVDSEIGMIPKGWEVKSLDEIANFLNGLAMQKFRPLDTDEEFLQVVKIKELKQGSTSSDSDRCSINIDEKYIINDGDVIFAWSGSLDVRIWCGGKAGLNQHLFKVTSDDYPKWFYYLWVKNYLEQFIRIAADRATTMGHIKRSNLTEAKVLIPDDSTLKVMGYTLENLVCKFIENNIESKSLIDLRDSLLPKLMSGEISVN